MYLLTDQEPWPTLWNEVPLRNPSGHLKDTQPAFNDATLEAIRTFSTVGDLPVVGKCTSFGYQA